MSRRADPGVISVMIMCNPVITVIIVISVMTMGVTSVTISVISVIIIPDLSGQDML